MSWRDRAACRGQDTERFFPLRPGDIPDDVVQTCAGCPVRVQCWEFAEATHSQFGVWAGTDREAMRRVRRRQPDRESAA
jgi:WhiB family transcriptional regulator, redox-sensing transcriptional regulator